MSRARLPASLQTYLEDPYIKSITKHSKDTISFNDRLTIWQKQSEEGLHTRVKTREKTGRKYFFFTLVTCVQFVLFPFLILHHLFHRSHVKNTACLHILITNRYRAPILLSRTKRSLLFLNECFHFHKSCLPLKLPK